jgi:hypothetical protein
MVDQEEISYLITSQSKITDFIEVYEDIVPHSLCDRIIEEFGNDEKLHLAPIGAHGIENTQIRNVFTLFISDPKIFELNKNAQSLDTQIHECMINAAQKYRKKHPTVHINSDTGYSFLKYNEGNFYKYHCDSFTERPRSVSCSIALNDDYEGGDFSFFGNELTYKLKKGSVLMFPSTYMYPHEILTVTKGTRYSIVTWFI